MEANEFFSHINLASEVVAIIIVACAIIAILFLNRHRLRERFNQWRIRRSLDQIGSEQIRNLVCADGLDGFYKIDRLALTPQAILVVNYKPFGGNIYCAEKISEWTQVLGQKSFKFDNPLFELENQLTSLRLIVGKAPLSGYLFFDQRAAFPKGHPEAVLHSGNIPEHFLRANCQSASSEIQAAWELLKTHHHGASKPTQLSAKT